MDDRQIVLAELLKLKAFIIGLLANHHLVVHPSDVLEKINQTIDLLKKDADK